MSHALARVDPERLADPNLRVEITTVATV